MQRLPRFLAVALAAVVAFGCSDAFKPAIADMVGNYSLQTLTTTDTSGTTDWVAAGSTLTLTLESNGTTSGHFFIPGTGGGSDFNADMAGTWTLTGDVITLDQGVDTFVRDMNFKAEKDRLAGDQMFSFNAVPTRVILVLTK